MRSLHKDPGQKTPGLFFLRLAVGGVVLFMLLLLAVLQMRQFDETRSLRQLVETSYESQAGMDVAGRQNLKTAIAAADQAQEKMVALTFGLEALLLLLLAFAAWRAGRSMAEAREANLNLCNILARHEAIFETATDAMIIHDPHGYIETVNPAAAALFGYDREELVGENVSIFQQNPRPQEEVEDYLAKLADTPENIASVREFPSRRKDGSIFLAGVATSPVPSVDGLRYLDVVRDVTERHRA